MTFAGVAPVEDEHAAVGTVTEFHAAKPRVARREKVRRVPADVAGTAAFEEFLIRAPAVQIHSEQMAAVFGRPVVAEINHHPDVRVTTTESVRLFTAGFRPALFSVEVPMVRMLVDESVGARVRINRVRPDEVGAGEVVPEVAVDGIDEEQFAVLVPIVSPRVGGAAAHSLHHLALRVIAPDRSAHRDASFRRRARHADFTWTRRAAATVEPAVRTKTQPIGKGVVHVRRTGEAVEHNLGRAVRHIVTIAVGNEKQLRRTHQPHAPVSDLDAGEHLHFVGKNFARVESAGAILVFKDENAIAQVQVELLRALGVGVVLGDPQTSARVPRHRDGVLHVGFRCEDGRFEAGRQP